MIVVLMIAALLQGSSAEPRTLEKGTQSYIDNARQVTARTAAEWQAIWHQHSPNRPLPEVDFDQEMVLGVFLGSRNSAGYSADIVSVEPQPDALVVRYREVKPARAAVTAQIVTSPYHLVAVPKYAGQVRFEKIE